MTLHMVNEADGRFFFNEGNRSSTNIHVRSRMMHILMTSLPWKACEISFWKSQWVGWQDCEPAPFEAFWVDAHSSSQTYTKRAAQVIYKLLLDWNYG